MLNQGSKQYSSNLKFLVRILREESILVKEIMNHACEHILLSLVFGILVSLQQCNDFFDSNLASVNLLEVGICDILNFRWKNSGFWASCRICRSFMLIDWTRRRSY